MGAADVKAGGHILFAKYAASLEEGAEPGIRRRAGA